MKKERDSSRVSRGQRTRPFGRAYSRSRREMVGRDCQLLALSKAKAETAPEAVRDQVRAGWRRWRNLLGCTAARATSLLEKRCCTVPPEHEVLRESRIFSAAWG